jgi:hypothetical protein
VADGSLATQPTKETEEEDYFTGSFGNALRGFDNIVPLGIGDFVDDMARSVSSGYRQGTVAEAADKLLLKGHKATPEQLQKFIDANKDAQQIKPSAEMQDYTKIYEEEGKGFWGVVKGLANNPSIIPEVMASSLTSMATNTHALTAAGTAIGAGAAYGAATGGAAGATGGSIVPVAGTAVGGASGVIAGAVSGAAASIPYAFGLASTVVETGATFGELLTEELKGKEMTKENVKAILESPDKLQSIRNKAIARGIVIGTLDALTGKLASGVGAKILTKSAAKSAVGTATKAAVVKSTAAGAGIEAIGGSFGEATARAVTGQDMDISEIALEGLAELPGGVRSTIQARFAKPSYKVNGEKVTAEDIDELTKTMTPEQLATTNIVINNDYEGRMFRIQDKVVTNTIKQEVRKANPNLNEPSLNAITELEKELQGLEGNKTQTGKDKAAILRGKIKDIQENQLVEEVSNEVKGSFEFPEDEKIAKLEAELETITDDNNPRIAEIDAEISELETLKTKQDAVQEQSTTEIPVQSETGVSETMEEGKPESKPEVITEQGAQEEVVKPLKDIESTANTLNEIGGENDLKNELAKKIDDKIGLLRDENGEISDTDLPEFKALKNAKESINRGVATMPEGGSMSSRNLDISETYHKAKEENNNPELVKAVEELLAPKVEEVAPTETIITEQTVTPDVTPTEAKTKVTPTEVKAEVTPVIESAKTAEEFITDIDEKANADENKVGYPIEVSKGVRISKVGNNYSISFPDNRTANGIVRKVNLTKEQAITILNKKIPKPTVATPTEVTPVVGKNISLRDYKTREVKGEELKVGDIYVRDENGQRYVYRLLETPRVDPSKRNFFNANVELIHIGEYNNSDAKKYGATVKNIGDKSLDRFKSSKANLRKFGNVKVIENWNEVNVSEAKPTEVKAEVKAEVVPTEVSVKPKDEAQQKSLQIVAAIKSLFDRNGKDTSKWVNQSDNRDLIALRRAKRAVESDAKTLKTFLNTSMGQRYLEMEAKFEKPKAEPKTKPTPKVEPKVETPKVEAPKTDKKIETAENDADFYYMKVEDIQEEINNENQATKEEVADINKKIADVKADKSLSRAEKKEAVEDLKSEIDNFKDNQEAVISDLKDDLREAKSDYKKSLKQLEKLKEQINPSEISLENVEGKIDDLLGLDPNDKSTLAKISSELGDMINEIKRIEKDLGSNILLVPMKYILQTIKGFVDAGMTLQEAIKRVAADNKVTQKDIVNGINSVTQIFPIQEKFNELMAKADKLIARQKSKGIDKKKIISNLDTMVRNSDVYKDSNTNDAQRKIMEREARAKMGVAQRKAPSIGRVLGVLNDIQNVSREEKLKIIGRIRELSRDAAKDLVQEIRELASGGKITAVQATNIISRFGKVNMLNEISVSNFVDYMAKVFADAEYGNKIEVAKSNLKTAKKNIVTKLGIADGLVLPLQRLFSINPTLIPDAYLDKYLSLVDMFSKKQSVLSLDEKSNVIKDVQEILDEINNEQSLVDELSDRFNNSDNKVFKDDKLDYAASLEKMLKEGDVDSDDVALMKKYKKDIAPQVEKTELTEEEIQAEKDVLVGLLNKATVDSTQLTTRDERNLAKQISSLIKKSGIKELTNTELKNILKVIDNINNGYLPHYAQLVVEKLNSIEDAKVLEEAINKAKPTSFTYAYSKIKSLITKKDSLLEMIRRNPLFYIDQLFGDFKTKDIFNSVLKKAAEAEAKFTSELKNVQAKLEKAEENIAKSFKLNPNKTLMSKFKMMTYMVQLEYDSNPNNKQVNSASEYLKATIKHIDDGKSQFGERDAEMLQKIYEEYTNSEGNIDNEKLYNSFNNAEKEGIKTIREINESLKEKAEYTGAIIRGQKINPLNNYVHLNVLHEHQPNDLASGTSFANDYNNSMRPTTKAKSLIERTGKVSPLNFDVFASAQRGSKFVLMDYHLTEPIRTARKTINKAISNLESTGRIPKEKRKIANAISNALEETVSNLITNSYTTTSIGDDVINYISKQGYRSVLAGTGRFAAEFISNVGFVIISDPTSFAEGIKNMGVIMSSDAPAIMSNVNSKEINRIFPTDTLSGRMVDTNILSQASGIKGGKSKNTVANKIQQILNLSGKKYVNAVELIADVLITTPDKAIMRPIWFGSFSENFRKITGKDVDFEKIAANDEAYMEENKDAIEEAKNIADERSVITGASSNAFTGILKGTVKPEQSNSIKAFNNFNGFMSRFLIYEFVTARTGVMAAMGNGSLTKRQGVALLAAVTTRMTVYSLLAKALGEGVIGLMFDDEEEEKKAPEKAVGQALASSFTSMIFGRDFGNLTKGFINYGLERVNENYLDFLREGDYDPYKDALQYSVVPIEKKGSQTDLSDFLFNMGGSFGPAIKTADLVVRKYFEPKKKEFAAVKRQEKEIEVRIPLEILGNLGLIPLYKEIRKSVMNDIYKDIKNKGGINKEELKKRNPRLYEKMYGENSLKNKSSELIEKMENKREEMENKLKNIKNED